MAERDRSICRHGQGRVKKCKKAWEFSMEAMQRQPVEEKIHATGSVEESWKAVMDWYQPGGDAESDVMPRRTTWTKT